MLQSKLSFLVVVAATLGLGVSEVKADNSSVLIQNMNRDALFANPTSQNNNAQVTSVSQFSDVQPTDWAFTALQSLVERYGCIAGYPNGTFRGNRATSRYEFAAGLNACLDKINELISQGLSDKVGKEDLATLQKLQEDFSVELTALKGRVSALEAKTATLEAQQFSTTTKLTGTAIFAAAGAFGDNTAANDNRNITFAGRVRLNFNTSFTGNDLLFIRLQAGNVVNNTSLATTALTFALPGNFTANAFGLERFFYRFPVSDRINFVIGTAVNTDNILNNINPDLSSDETGALSRFGNRDPLVFRGQGDLGTAAGVQIKFGEQLGFNLAYQASNASNPTGVGASGDAGLFGGGYSGSAQILFTPVKPLTLSFVYQRSYDPNALNLTNGTGTSIATNPASGIGNAGLFTVGTSADRFGFQTNFDVSPNLSLNGRVSYVSARAVSGGGTIDILSWLATVSFKDVFAQGNQATLAFGQPPYVIGGNVLRPDGSQNPYHIEAFYRLRLSRNISITPGLITILNPGFINATGGVDNSPVFVGVLRTAFTF